MKQHVYRIISTVKDLTIGWHTRGFFRGWQFTVILIIALLFFLAPERMIGYWSYVARSAFGLSMIYMIVRIFLVKDNDQERTHNLVGERKSDRELAIAIMVAGAFIGAGAGAFG